MQILIIDDHALFRAGLRMLLSTIGGSVHCLEAADIEEALGLVARNPALELCLLDLALRNESGLDAIQRLKEAAPQIAVVVVSGAEDGATIRRCIDSGAMSFIPKSVPPEVLTRALQHVLRGEVYLPEQIASTRDEPSLPHLTVRQREVLRALSRGLPTKLIARELGLSEHTVKDHIAVVLEVLGARNRTEAVIKASQLGLSDAVGKAPA